MAHPNEELLRTVYAKFAQGDIEGFLRLCTPGVRFHFRGDNAVSGDHDGEGFKAVAARFMELAGTSLHEELEDVLVNDRRGVVFLDSRLTRVDGGGSFELSLVHVFRFEGGKIARFDELPVDQREFDEAWAPLRPAARPPEGVAAQEGLH